MHDFVCLAASLMADMRRNLRQSQTVFGYVYPCMYTYHTLLSARRACYRSHACRACSVCVSHVDTEVSCCRCTRQLTQSLHQMTVMHWCVAVLCGRDAMSRRVPIEVRRPQLIFLFFCIFQHPLKLFPDDSSRSHPRSTRRTHLDTSQNFWNPLL